MTDNPSPPARRLRPPSWLDIRLVVGVLMVLVAVLVGARVVAGADKSVRVWSLAHDVSAGATLGSSDVHTVRVRLYGDPGHYLAAGTSPIGRAVNRDLRDGDLLPSTALGPIRSGVLVPLPVPVVNMPADVGPGDRIAVYTGPRTQSAQQGSTTPVLAGLTVQSLTSGARNLGGSDETAQLIVEVYAAADAKVLLNAVATGTLYVVKEVGATSSAGGRRSTDAPAPAATPRGDWMVGGPSARPPATPSTPSASPTPSR